MQNRHQSLFAAVRIIPAVLIMLLFLPLAIRAQIPNCVYDQNAPSAERARANFLALNYDCAEAELIDLLRIDTLDLQQKADAHVLLAQVFYAKVKGDEEKHNMVLEQFVATFRAFRAWKGALDVKAPEFLAVMKEAQDLVDKEPPQAEAQPAPEQKTWQPPPISEKKCAPKSTMAWIATGLFVGSAGFFIISSSDAGSKWDDYESNPDHPRNLYDEYESANSQKKVAGVLTVATGIVSGYLWMKHFGAEKKCRETTSSVSQHGGLKIYAGVGRINLVYNF